MIQSNPIYEEIITFLNKNGIDEQEVEYVGLSKKGNLKIVFYNGKMEVTSNFPESWKNRLEEDENKKEFLKQWFKNNQTRMNEFMEKNYKINENIYFLFDSKKNHFSLIFVYFNSYHAFDFSYQSLSLEIDLFYPDRLGIDLNLLKNIFDRLLEVFENATAITEFNFISAYIASNTNSIGNQLNLLLEECSKNIKFKNGDLSVLTNEKYIKTNLSLKDLFDLKDFDYDVIQYKNRFLPFNFKINKNVLEEKVDLIISEIVASKVTIKPGQGNYIFYFDYVKDFNKKVSNILYTGLNPIPKNYDAMLLKTTDFCNYYLYNKNEYFETVQSEDNFEMLYNGDKRKINFIMSSKFDSAIDYLKQKFNSYKLSYKSGYGLLFGNTTVIVDDLYEIEFEIQSIVSSKKKWELSIEKNINSLKQKILDCKKKDYDNLKQSAPNLYGSILAFDVMKMVEKNEKYITANAVIQSLRGLNVRLNADIKPIENSGKYNIVSNETIENIINSLIKEKYLKRKSCSGYYDTFYILKTTGKTFHHFAPKEQMIQTRFLNNERLSFYEFEYIFNKENKNEEDDNLLLTAIENFEFLCFYKEEYIAYIRQFENFKLLFKMKYDNGFYDTNKNIKRIVKEIIKK